MTSDCGKNDEALYVEVKFWDTLYKPIRVCLGQVQARSGLQITSSMHTSGLGRTPKSTVWTGRFGEYTVSMITQKRTVNYT